MYVNVIVYIVQVGQLIAHSGCFSIPEFLTSLDGKFISSLTSSIGKCKWASLHMCCLS